MGDAYKIIQSKAATPQYKDNYEKIFRKPEENKGYPAEAPDEQLIAMEDAPQDVEPLPEPMVKFFPKVWARIKAWKESVLR